MLIRYKNVLSEITQVQIINIPALNNIQALKLQAIDADPIYVITGEHTERIINNMMTRICTDLSKYDVYDKTISQSSHYDKYLYTVQKDFKAPWSEEYIAHKINENDTRFYVVIRRKQNKIWATIEDNYLYTPYFIDGHTRTVAKTDETEYNNTEIVLNIVWDHILYQLFIYPEKEQQNDRKSISI